MTPTPGTIPVSWSAALATPPRSDRALVVWMRTRRWSGTKDRAVARTTAEGLVELADDVALVVVRVEFSDAAGDQAYFVPLALIATSPVPPDAVAVAVAADGVIVFTMTVDGAAGIVIAAALRSGQFIGRANVATGKPRRSGLDHHLLSISSAVHLLTAEQSNTSVIVGGEVIGKIVRRLAVGDSLQPYGARPPAHGWLPQRSRCGRHPRRRDRRPRALHRRCRP